MIRGTFILICQDCVMESLEFNGGMDPEQHGETALEMLSEVTDKASFKKMIIDFNESHHNYDDDQLWFTYTRENYLDGVSFIDFNKDYGKRFFSDYLYIKNISDMPLDILDTEQKEHSIAPGETAVINFGKLLGTKMKEYEVFVDTEIPNKLECYEVVKAFSEKDAEDQIQRKIDAGDFVPNLFGPDHGPFSYSISHVEESEAL